MAKKATRARKATRAGGKKKVDASRARMRDLRSRRDDAMGGASGFSGGFSGFSTTKQTP